MRSFMNLYTSPNKITVINLRRMRLAGHVSSMGEKRNAYRDFGGKNNYLGIPKCRLY
jgi:hypothetical protein